MFANLGIGRGTSASAGMTWLSRFTGIADEVRADGQKLERPGLLPSKDQACGERIRALQPPSITFGSREIAGSSFR
jgi:hypothetical protein